jgi:hypothetical protein
MSLSHDILHHLTLPPAELYLFSDYYFNTRLYHLLCYVFVHSIYQTLHPDNEYLLLFHSLFISDEHALP